MIYKIYAIKDNKVGTFSPPFFSFNTTAATRMFGISCRDKTVQLSHYPEDFDLFTLGEFDDCTGKFTTIDPQFVIGAVALQTLQKQEGVEAHVTSHSQPVQSSRKG